MTRREAAELTGYSPTTIALAAKRGEIKIIGRKKKPYNLSQASVRAWKRAQLKRGPRSLPRVSAKMRASKDPVDRMFEWPVKFRGHDLMLVRMDRIRAIKKLVDELLR